jgi:hypothetical protein
MRNQLFFAESGRPGRTVFWHRSASAQFMLDALAKFVLGTQFAMYLINLVGGQGIALIG